MKISSSVIGIFGSACTGSISPFLAEAAPQPLGFGDTLSIRAVNGPIIVYTINLSGSVSSLLQANKLVINYRTKVIAHLPRSDYSTFQFQVHLTLKDKQGEVLDVIDFNCSESKPEGSITVPVSEAIARKVNSVSAKLFAS